MKTGVGDSAPSVELPFYFWNKVLSAHSKHLKCQTSDHLCPGKILVSGTI